MTVVADDDRLDRSVVVAVCKSLGARDAEAGVSGAEHLGLLRDDPPRLVLVHPLLRSEVDLFEPAAQVRAVHRAIADTLRRDTDLERRDVAPLAFRGRARWRSRPTCSPRPRTAPSPGAIRARPASASCGRAS